MQQNFILLRFQNLYKILLMKNWAIKKFGEQLRARYLMPHFFALKFLS
jgi:hypothetical protein